MPSNNSSFYSDSGASYHIVNDHSLLSDIRKSNVRIDSIHGVEENVQFGTLLCQFFNGTVWLDIKLLDVAFIPNQPFNLISTGNLTNPRIHSGMKVIEEDGKLTVYRFGKPILTGEQTSEIRNLYKLNVRPVNRNTTMASVSSDDFVIWHERLCHCSTSVLERMVALKTIIGLPKDIRNNIAYCSTCHTGKMTDVSHKPVASVNENIVSGMKLHVDIGGYMKPSIHGNQYYLLAVDDSSSYLKIGFMKQRSEVYDKLKLFINENIVPYEEYFGKSVDVSNLRVFGSKGESWIPKHGNKFSTKSESVFMVGYNGSNIYRVYCPDRRCIKLSSSVKFDETSKCRLKSVEVESNSGTIINIGEKSDDDEKSSQNAECREVGRPR
ncbi:hypothetical protein HUG17_1415 [Dermatophagoides farinae]|uniref:GAG-pre-integrase domain-containing protein n=1 Tax=Dermatophagoides farinae TaxID=6954 RepID=A0A9D4SL80_DERFA|nr:hypothetical protein HUG17_1415 [Dermatophagoides farinae]